MKTNAFLSAILTFILAAMLAVPPVMAQQAAKVTEEEAVAIGTEAYIYGYPLVTPEQVQSQPGRFGGPLHPERLAGQGEGVELAPRPCRQVHLDAQILLAERGDSRR